MLERKDVQNVIQAYQYSLETADIQLKEALGEQSPSVDLISFLNDIDKQIKGTINALNEISTHCEQLRNIPKPIFDRVRSMYER